jgi:hypothetical protein
MKETKSINKFDIEFWGHSCWQTFERTHQLLTANGIDPEIATKWLQDLYSAVSSEFGQ